MPFTYRIDTNARLVITVGYGEIRDEDVSSLQQEFRSRPDVAGFDELVDMTRATAIVDPLPSRIRDLAALSAGMDGKATRTRLAIVAPHDLVFGLGRMYQNYHELRPLSMREVGVFRTMEEALAFLEMDRIPMLPEMP